MPTAVRGSAVRSPNRRVVAGTLVAAVLAGATLVSPGAVFDGFERLAADPLVFGGAVLALYLVRPLLAWPQTACAVVVGYGYGVYGLPVALGGAALTALGPFYATRWTLGAGTDATGEATDRASDGDGSEVAGGVGGWVTARADRALAAGERFFETAGGIRGVTAARLAPVPSDVTTCAAAACGVRTRAMVVGTLLGELPWTLAAVLVGASAGEIASGIGDAAPPVAVASALVAALLLAGPAYRYLQAVRAGQSPG